MLRRPVIGWAMYDFGNSAYATTVMAVFFPIFFNDFWSAGADPQLTTLRLGAANSAASLLIALLAPVIGAIADRGGARKRFLAAFATLGVVMSAGLFLVQQGAWPAAVAAYVVATMGFTGANVFYDSLIVDVADDREFDVVSAFGYSLGYLGGGLLFLLNVLMTLNPDWFGFADAAVAVRWSFLSVAVWWALFSLPLLLLVRERRPAESLPLLRAVGGGFRQLVATFDEIRALRYVAVFLGGYFLYIDGVHTIITMAVDYGVKLGFPRSALILALLITQFVGFPAALAFGWFGDRFGTRRMIVVAICCYMAVNAWAYFLDTVEEFYLMAISIGLVQGGVQSLSRSFYARLIPQNKSAEFFGFYNMLGKFAAILGPLLVGGTAVLTGDPRLAILVLLVLFAAGLALLLRVDVRGAERAAERLERI